MNQANKALHYLENSLVAGFWKPGDRLPGLSELSKVAGVSRCTMSKAVRILSEKGMLSVQAKSGIWVSSSENPQPQIPTTATKKWEKVKARISSDILSRLLNEDLPLPSLKEMRNQYGVSFPVIKKALRSLESDGLLTAYKKTFKPTFFSIPGPGAKLLLLISVDPEKLDKNAVGLLEKGFRCSHRGLAFLKELELFCSTQNLTYDIWGYFFHNNSTVFISPDFSQRDAIEKTEFYYGICLLKIIPFSNDFSRMLSQIAAFSKPISIFEETEEIWAIPKTKNKSIRIFPVAKSDIAAQKIGRFLWQRGHREIAFFSSWHYEQWSKDRYLGLCKAFALTGNSHTVHLVADNQMSTQNHSLEYKKFQESTLPLPTLQNILQTHTNFPQKQTEILVSKVEENLYKNIILERIGLFLQPLFEKTLDNHAITAWVGVDDRIAFFALRYLQEMGVKIPQRISVVGFEDVPEAYFAGLTSYNFDIRGVTQNMLAFISNPGMFSEKKDIIDGFVASRHSTSYAPEIG